MTNNMNTSMFILLISFASWSGTSAATSPPLVLVYETDAEQLQKNKHNFIFQQLAELPTRIALRDNVRVVGTGQQWNGWGSKAKHVYEALSDSKVDPNQLVVVTDSRDVLGNNLNEASMERLVANYESLTANKPGAIVVGAEKQCCVAAMTHSNPGSFLTDTLERKGHLACNSGQSGCLHRGDEHQRPWIEQLKHVAKARGTNSKNIYPNSGIIVGTAKNIKAVYDILDMKETEDDQALFTELMIKRPSLIVMDYDQQIIGNNVWSEGMDGCIFDWDDEKNAFVHPSSKSIPAFLHFQGKFFECYGKMAQKMGYIGDMKRKLAEAGPDNYGGPRVEMKQIMILADQLTMLEAQAAVDSLNLHKEAIGQSLYTALNIEGVKIIVGNIKIKSSEPVSARRLAEPSAVVQDVRLEVPYEIDMPEAKAAEVKTELTAWSQSTPTGVVMALNTHGGRTFETTISEPQDANYNAGSSIILSKIFVAIAAVMCAMTM